ncbi:unnamed protein product [[Candida] boidinii]|nr:unnamed protein product [[Candida] boidinii]
MSWTEAQKYMDHEDDFDDYKEVHNVEPETVVVDDDEDDDEDDDDVQEIDFEDVSIEKPTKSTDEDPADTEFIELEGTGYTNELKANNEAIKGNKDSTNFTSDNNVAKDRFKIF